MKRASEVPQLTDELIRDLLEGRKQINVTVEVPEELSEDVREALRRLEGEEGPSR